MKRNIWLDGMMGVVVGDALGCPIQFLKREEIKNRPEGPVIGMEAGGIFNVPAGTWMTALWLLLLWIVSSKKEKQILPI